MKNLLRYVRLSLEIEQTEQAIRRAMWYNAKNLNGDYLEFGCYSATTLSHAYFYGQYYKRKFRLSQVKYWAFDSFKGLPKPKKEDLGEDDFTEGGYSQSKKDFLRAAQEKGVRLKDLIVVPGFYSKSLKKIRLKEPVGVVYIDCDFYSSTKTVLEWLTPYVSEGTIILYDDWLRYKAQPGKGEQKAHNEWLKESNIQVTRYLDNTKVSGFIVTGVGEKK